MLFAAIQLPCIGFAAEEDKELSLIAAEQNRSEEDEQLGEINPALTDTISTERTQETDKDKKERKKKLKQVRKEKEKTNEQKLKESANQKNDRRKENKEDSTIVIEPQPEPQPQPRVEPQPEPQPQPRVEPQPEPQPKVEPQPQPQPQPSVESQPQPIMPNVETTTLLDEKMIYANFAEAAHAVKFIPLYMPRKSGYEITAIFASQGIVEVRYGRRWEPTVSLTVRTYKRRDGEEPQDISGVTGVKWRVDTSTGTTIYIAKISEIEQVAAWAVGHYTFSAQAENLSYAGFYSLVVDELVELSRHYYLDL